jgi:hypothetical protein
MKQVNQYQGLNIHSPLSESNVTYLSQLKSLIEASVAESARILAFRFDLRFPENYKGGQEKVITKFFESLKAQIKAKDAKSIKDGKRVYPCRLKYAWVRENGGAMSDHFHVVVIFNKDAFAFVGDYDSAETNTARRIKKAWSSALGCKEESAKGLVHFPKSAIYILNKNKETYQGKYRLLYYRISYLAKNRTKVYGTGKRSFGCSWK